MGDTRKELPCNSIIPSFARGLNILLVDHDTTSLIYLSSMLQQYSYKVTTTQLASIGLSMVLEQKDRFKLVMANVNMQDMDRVAFLRVILEKNIPVILISSERSESAAMKAIAEGASFYLQKPISFDDLKYVWQHVYRKKRSATNQTGKRKCPQHDESYNGKKFQGVVDGSSCSKVASRNTTDTKGKGKEIEEENRLLIEKNCIKKSENTCSSKQLMADSNGLKVKSLDEDAECGNQEKRHKIMVEEDNTKGQSNNEGQEDKDEKKFSNNSSSDIKPRILWTPELHRKFTAAISALGDKKARPKPILEMMNVPHLTQRQVASHLQKYKSQVQRICESGTISLPAVSRLSNFYGRTSILETLEKKTSPWMCQQASQSSNFGFQGEMLQAPKLPSEICIPDLTSSYGLQNKNQVPLTSRQATQDLDFSLSGQFTSGNFPSTENQSLEFTEVSNTNPESVPNADKFLLETNDWNDELDVMRFLDPTSGESTDLDNILTVSIDKNQEQEANANELLSPTIPSRNVSLEAEITEDGKQKLDVTAADVYINQNQPMLEYSDLLNILEEEEELTAASFKNLEAQPNPADVDRYCEWLTDVLLGGN